MLNTIALETWIRASQNLISLYQLRLHKVLNQSARHLVFVKGERYEIETIQSSTDFYAALKLRRTIEKSNHKLRVGLSDFALADDFDIHADHVMIRDTKTGHVVGGFRLLSTPYTQTFFNELIFNIDNIKRQSVAILELSRLFLLPEHNHKEMMALAARFLSQYCLAAKTEIILSNQSINSGASRSAALVNQYFNSVGLHSSFFKCQVQDTYQIPNYQHWNNYFKNGLNDGELIESASLLPTVFRDSLNIGATIAAPPGFDRTTNRIDFLTILHKEDLNTSLWKQSSPHSELSIEFSYFSQ
jgi:putative hemolysin